MVDPTWCNHSRFDPKVYDGFYESWFLRANDPATSRAVWVRYTFTVPRGRSSDGVVELWAIAFDGDKRTSARQAFPARDAFISLDDLEVSVGEATLSEGLANGSAGELSWALHWSGAQAPALLLPERLYSGRFPRAKALTTAPNAKFHGLFHAFGQRWVIEQWPGAQAHNWGSEHTERYAWGQVCGFDGSPDAFLECATARVRVAGILGPPLTMAVLRVDGEEYSFTGLLQGARAKSNVRVGEWTFSAESPAGRLSARLSCPVSSFVALQYPDPPGGARLCLNTKTAACELSLERDGKDTLQLRSLRRAAFELIGYEQPA